MRALLFVSLTIALANAVSSGRRSDLPPDFVGIVPGDIKWIANPTVPDSAYALLVGNPNKPGLVVVRVRLPPNTTVPPHTHPEARTYTVLAGEWKLGFGDTFDGSALRTYPAGSFYRLPAAIPHFQATGPVETVVQIESIGPTSTDFIGKK